MNNVLGNNTKAKVLFVVLAILLTLATWYKLKVQGITMTASAEIQYETILACEKKDEEHVHTEDCYKVIAIEKISDEKEIKNEENKEDVAVKTDDNKEKVSVVEENKSEKTTTQPEQAKTENKDVEEKIEKSEKASSNSEKTTSQKDEANSKTSVSPTNGVDNEKVASQKDVLDKEKVEKQKEPLNEKESNSKEEVKQDETQKISEKEDTKTDVKDNEKDVEDVEEPPIKQVPPKELKYENNELVVTATAIDDGAIPENATINVKKIDKKDKKYSEIEAELNSKAEENEEYDCLAGFVAYDITLKDSQGKEIEPNGKVNIVIDYKSAILPVSEKEDKDELSVNVHHFEENSKGEVVSVIDLAENKQLQKVELDKELKLEKVEFETESFSTFTITYYRNNTTYAIVNVHYVDEGGNEITANNVADVSRPLNNTTTTDTITLSTYNRTINGYVFKDAHYASYNGKTITQIQGRRAKNSASINTNTVNCTITFLNGNDIVGLLEYENSTRVIDVYLVYASTTSVSIRDTIAIDGCINALSNGNLEEASSTVKYKWYRSTDGSTYNEVKRIKVTGNLYNITVENGPSLNVALDEGADKYYKVEKYFVREDGTEELVGSAEYHVPYYNDVRNGNFENPVITEGATIQVPNGTEGVIWKTTGPGTGSHTGADIEILNAADANGHGANDLATTIRSYNFAYVPDGNQCAELNCEASGALYQDVLTVPGSQLYWSLYHRARGRYNGNNGGIRYDDNSTDTMYVVAMSTEAAEKYDVTTQAKVLAVLQKVQNQEPGFEDVEIVTLTTTNNGKGIMKFTNGAVIEVNGITYGSGGSNYGSSAWHYYSGHFSIPEEQYLTRFFFVAGSTASGNNTVGNLLDNIVLSDEVPPPNDGQATLRIKKVVADLQELPSDYSVPIEVSYVSDGSTITRTRDYNTYSLVYDENDMLTGERTQWHDYTLTIPANGTGKLNYAKENDSNKYMLAGYNLNTTIKVTRISRNGTKTTLYTGNVKGFTESDLSDANIYEGDFVEVEITNMYELNVAEILVNKTDMEGNLITGGAVFKVHLKSDANTNQTIGDLATATAQYTVVDGNEDGKIAFSNLKFSTSDTSPEYIYVLTEMESPKGYYKFDTPIEFYVKYDSVNQKANVIIRNVNEVSKYVTASNNEITVKDMPYVTMPEAGGEGVYNYYIIGTFLILSAIITIFYRKIKLNNVN